MTDSRSSSGMAELRQTLDAIARTTFSGSEVDDAYIRGNREAHATCAAMVRHAITILDAAQSSTDCGEMAAQIEELKRRVTAHEQLQARIVQALGQEIWPGDIAVAVEAEVARANGNEKSCTEAFKVLEAIRNSAAETLRMPWLLGSPVTSTDREGK